MSEGHPTAGDSSIIHRTPPPPAHQILGLLISFLALFPFVPDAQPAWQTVCDGTPYVNGTRIPDEVLEAFSTLHGLGIAGFQDSDLWLDAGQVQDACENFQAFREAHA